MSESVSDMPARLAVLEEIASGTKAALERIERRLDGVDGRLRSLEVGLAELRGHVEIRFAVVDARFAEVGGRIEGLRGRLEAMPTTWQMIATVIGGQIALAAIVIAAIRFALH